MDFGGPSFRPSEALRHSPPHPPSHPYGISSSSSTFMPQQYRHTRPLASTQIFPPTLPKLSPATTRPHTSRRHSSDHRQKDRSLSPIWLITTTLLYLLTLHHLPPLPYLLLTLPSTILPNPLPHSFLPSSPSCSPTPPLKTVTPPSHPPPSHPPPRHNLLIMALLVAFTSLYTVPPFFALLHVLACRVPVLGGIAVFAGLVACCASLVVLSLVIVGLHTWDITVIVHGVVVTLVRTVYSLAFPSKEDVSDTASTATSQGFVEYERGRNEGFKGFGRRRGGGRVFTPPPNATLGTGFGMHGVGERVEGAARAAEEVRLRD
ncbi:hypothetical protein BC829DRAFT_440449 [Chytridium lagenaria]|nr:hypothetical protein BC829DRAFT_440449 [Chytridium lagenaria]